MSWLDRFRDWARGYTEDDIDSALQKLEDHWALPAGAIIHMSGREMKAIIGEGMMSLFWHVRDLRFVDHPLKRRDAASNESQGEK